MQPSARGKPRTGRTVSEGVVVLHRIYIDEVGNHDLTHADDPNQRFLSLTGVILEAAYTTHTLQPEMDEIKRMYFVQDPDEPVIFHRKELVNRRS